MVKYYDEFDYWTKRKNPNAVDYKPLTKEESYLLKTYAKGRVLDYGPGLGRYFNYYKNCDEVVGVDISPTYKDRVRKSAEENSISYHHILLNDNVNLSLFEDNSFDRVVSIKVLQHVIPDKVEPLMKELLRIGKIVVIYNGVSQNNTHCFVHDYNELIDNIGGSIIDSGKNYYVYE